LAKNAKENTFEEKMEQLMQNHKQEMIQQSERMRQQDE